jgi:pimeloyl-ACP methyl ester carboxylesterase
MPDPGDLPAWLTEADLDMYAETFRRTGFRGALNRYRNLDRDWEDLAGLANNPIEQPVLFVGGELDSALRFGSTEPLRTATHNLTKLVLLPGCGHWTQQERPSAVTNEIVTFLARDDVYAKRH